MKRILKLRDLSHRATEFYTLCILACILNKKGLMIIHHKPLIYMVGAKGFEPSTPCSQSRCATRLRHAPKKNPRRCGAGKLWGERWDLNPRPPGPQPGALPTELLPPRENSYKQVILVWQAFFPHSFIWILSRKVTTLASAAWLGGKIPASQAICPPRKPWISHL